MPSHTPPQEVPPAAPVGGAGASRGRRVLRWGVATLAALAVLSIPPRTAPTGAAGAATPFRWDAASLFEHLEGRFAEVRGWTADEASAALDDIETRVSERLAVVADATETPVASLEALARLSFDAATLAAAHPHTLDRVDALVARVRTEVMRRAAEWPPDRATHEALYRVVAGGRIAVEEAMAQAPGVLPDLLPLQTVQSPTPYLEVAGVRVHSGDILLSRGGAPTSALIARGSDFANTFSHAALAHVDPDTGVGTVVESLIETGTVLTTVEDYLASKKHKILVLRMRPDHPALVEDPQLPHRAAAAMLARLGTEHVPYDFAMAWEDDARMFCSEVIYHAYAPEGVDLWPIRSSMTAPGLVRWLGAMGVRNFTTLVPSDLEFDPQLAAVAEWRDGEALMDYRLDNAITDVLLEAADAGAELGYGFGRLPAGRLVKGWSMVQDVTGFRPVIPAGMGTDAALRVSSLVSTVNPEIKAELVVRERDFVDRNGFRAPYWTLVGLARDVLEDVREELRPALRQAPSRP